MLVMACVHRSDPNSSVNTTTVPHEASEPHCPWRTALPVSWARSQKACSCDPPLLECQHKFRLIDICSSPMLMITPSFPRASSTSLFTTCRVALLSAQATRAHWILQQGHGQLRITCKRLNPWVFSSGSRLCSQKLQASLQSASQSSPSR